MKVWVLLFALTSFCATTQKIEFDPIAPTQKEGCGNAGTKFFECLKKQSIRWETIESAQGVFFVESSDREGDFIVSKGRLCFSEYFCRPYSKKDSSPSFITRAKEFGTVFLLGIVAGFGAASR